MNCTNTPILPFIFCTLKRKQVALGAWDTVMAYTFETSPAFLVSYRQERLTKSEEEYARAMTFLAKEGECAQCRAVEHLSTSLEHWGFWRVMNEVRGGKLVRGAYDQFLRDVEAKIGQSLQELKQVMDDPFAFGEEFSRFPKLFS